jgi:hypothetical protein
VQAQEAVEQSKEALGWCDAHKRQDTPGFP